jgi:hypothetical protein
MKTPEQISASQMERMMKFQEAILKAMAGKLKWWEEAEILGITDRQLRRIRERYAEHGYDGLYDYRKRQPSPQARFRRAAATGADLVSGTIQRLQRAAFP